MAPDGGTPADALHRLLEKFESYYPDRIDLSLDRIRRLLNALGNPQDGLPPVIHVAGTNGKGSVIAFLRAIFEAAGQTVSAYTSPHLVRINERFVLGGAMASDTRLVELFRAVDEANGGRPVTHFESLTAAGFLGLAQTPADIVLLETGLGGRFDATNIIAPPLATIITPVSRDHERFLGSDLTGIAGEKAAIQKEGTPSIIAPQTQDVAAVIEAAALSAGAPLYRAGREWRFDPSPEGFVLHGVSGTTTLPLPALAGPHQIANAATAAACIDVLRPAGIAPHHIAAGIAGVNWPGRLQVMGDGALRCRLPGGWEVRLDVAHNHAGAQALAATLGGAEAGSPHPLHMILALPDDKDPRAYLAPFAGRLASLVAIPLPDWPHGHTPEALAEAAQALGIAASTAATVADAFDMMAGLPQPGRLLVAGSHMLVGAVLRQNDAHVAAAVG